VIENSDNYRKSEYYILNPENYREFTALDNAPLRIKNNLIDIDPKDWNKISMEKEKEYFI
jgi:hypothetical protein